MDNPFLCVDDEEDSNDEKEEEEEEEEEEGDDGNEIEDGGDGDGRIIFGSTFVLQKRAISFMLHLV